MNKPYFAHNFNKLRAYPPPPPPPKASHMGRNAAIAVVLIAILVIPIVFFSGLFNVNPQPSPSPSTSSTPYSTNTPFSTATPSPSSTPPPQTNNQVTITKGQATQVATQTIDSNGGEIQASSSSAVNGLKIKVPEAATNEPIQFAVSYSDVSSITGLPAGASVASKMISIHASGSAIWNQYEMFDKPVTVTLPYDSNIMNNDDAPVRFYWYDSQTGKLDSTGFLSEDLDAHTITFLTASFSDFFAIQLVMQISELSGGNFQVDTGFRPVTDGWYIPNYGSYLTSGGMCLGMVSYAKWYDAYITPATGTGLYTKYIEGVPTEWRDDNTAIQLASRAHLATSGIWTSLTTEEQDWAKANAREEGLSWIHGMLVTGQPQLIGLKARTNNGTWLNYAHAVMTYEYSNGKFEIYDPNFPGSVPGDAMREIPFTYTNGFSETYVSGTTRADSLVFNIFYHAGSKLAATPDDYRGLYDAAQTRFQDTSVFPTVTLTDISTTPTGTTPTDTNGDGIRDTPLDKVTISGTITGGTRDINSTLLFVDNQKYTVTVENGVFSQEVPMLNGDNDIAVLATDVNTFSNWAGFLRDTIRCNASVASLTVTLTWDQDNSDVDLHILEPGADGRHIYYQNKGDPYGTNPYLDIDNTHGYGPEHYFATEGMTLPSSTTLYGTYQIRVHYYSDHSGADTTQPITWHLSVKYLAFKNPNTGQEFWVQESRNGALSTADSSGTSDFSNGSAAWSSIWTINYQVPNMQDYGIPPPPQNQFPT